MSIYSINGKTPRLWRTSILVNSIYRWFGSEGEPANKGGATSAVNPRLWWTLRALAAAWI